MTNPARVLVVEDDDTIRTALVAAVESRGWVALGAVDGGELEQQLDTFRPDLVILDWMLPGRSGIELARVVSAAGDAGMILLTARDGVDDKLRGFDVGVDDYLAKPFVMAELVARMTAILRRRGRAPGVLEIGDLLVDLDAGAVVRARESIVLTGTELRLLAFLAGERGRTLSKTQILTQVWGYDSYDPNLVEVHVSSLRRKLEERGGTRLIQTVRGIGYVLRAA
ncbi:response regulator transcription factor [Aeromicrobium fastidiosum]|uniref:Response regulator transcription factor n=1 Tax=Aeromicrobium fastidiosum TaxID=52699 RepID=A0A641AM44_9ACTN|nr:response regulator transcription factor [Aeromicrobium fastidiosum]KAA1378350.1 response regulator transcription factor [Aeromicrobium fastidiosum]MBP2392702.1 DNA-binding response OmpR family regulator [Aeromicrobium fastidiosum]